MKTLNLTNLDDSDIKYKIITFPDSQNQIVIDTESLYKNDIDELNVTHVFIDKHIEKYVSQLEQSVQINSRLNSFKDLELIICATKSLRNLGVKEIHLYTPYFLGSRSDRQFEEGSNNYLKDVICPIINSLEFESVTVLDPHSDVLEACLNNFNKESNLKLVEFALLNIDKLKGSNDFILVSPDAGASKKIYKIAEQIGYKGDIITCSKDRDENGKLTKTIVPINDLLSNTINKELNKDFIIIDDICDGGATFINIAKEIKEKSKHFKIGKIYLIVTHGIFSQGYSELTKYFDGVYCTNSYSNTLKGSCFNYDTTDLVKQLNVF
jgi:ribose-phosphate pyrophosphokinase